MFRSIVNKNLARYLGLQTRANLTLTTTVKENNRVLDWKFFDKKEHKQHLTVDLDNIKTTVEKLKKAMDTAKWEAEACLFANEDIGVTDANKMCDNIVRAEIAAEVLNKLFGEAQEGMIINENVPEADGVFF